MDMNVNLGKDVKGKDIFIDFDKENIHFIILGGGTGSGKSVFHLKIYEN